MFNKKNVIFIIVVFCTNIIFSQSENMEKNHWLRYFVENESFKKEVDIQLKPQFEALLGKKLNWERIFLFIDFYKYSTSLHKEPKMNMCLDKIQLVFRASVISASLSWHAVNGDELITVYDPIKSGEVIFDLKILDDSMKGDFPAQNDPFIKTKFEIGADFPVFINTDFLTDEVYFYFDMEDESEMHKLEKSICDFVEIWSDLDVLLTGKFPEKKVEINSVEFGGQVLTSYHTNYNLLTENIDFLRYLMLYLSEEVKGIKSITIGTK